MSSVRIKGVISTTTLKRGDERTVERTKQVDGLIEKGYVKVVTADKAAAEELPEQAGDPELEVIAPSANASKQEWRDFLLAVGIDYTEEDTRAELIARWDGTPDA